MLDRQFQALAENHAALDVVLKLADVARPIVVAQQAASLRDERA